MSCSICLEILSDPSVCITLHSNHEFHVKCLLKWINAEGKIWYENKAQCPLCRQDLIQQDFENIAKYLITIYQNKQYQNVMCIEDIDAIHSVIDLLIMKFRQIEIARDVIEKCIIEKYDITQISANILTVYSEILHQEFNEYEEALKYFQHANNNQHRVCTDKTKINPTLPAHIGIIKELHLKKDLKDVIHHYQESLHFIQDPELKSTFDELMNISHDIDQWYVRNELESLRWHLLGLLIAPDPPNYSYYSYLCFTKSTSCPVQCWFKDYDLFYMAKYFAAKNQTNDEFKCYDRILEINDVNDNTIEIYWHVHSAIIKLEVINIINNIQKSSNFSPLQIYETNIDAVKKIETHFQNLRDMCQRGTVSIEAALQFHTLLRFMLDLYIDLIEGAEINQLEEYKKEYTKKLEITFEMEATYLLSMARGAYEENQCEVAVNYVKNALSISDLCGENINQVRYNCYYLFGEIEERYEEWKNAIEWYEKCYELNQNNLISNFQILTFMANCYENMGVKEEAINILKTRMVEIIEKDEQLKKENLYYLMSAYRLLGCLYNENNDISMKVMYYEKFLQQTETMIAEHHASVDVMSWLGWYLHVVLKKDFERAKDLYERALSINDECDYLCHSYAHLMHYHYKDYVKAKKYYELAIELSEEEDEYLDDYNKLLKEMNSVLCKCLIM
eukprot:311362_1